ncbi:aldehyde dehydrogenase (NAD+) mitochondrial [Fusarium albosuccineum]|uniref:aldehyde dehydrogenase (NAD(+)) n=1 Tax=Fusarium albosuccineum TaxID=1237068 RepID=A0A8H4LHT0_9HYPO|nr:aldehyde dehydrogenase (NAD+) mitochondrial [Fusarium albosuccineum]
MTEFITFANIIDGKSIAGERVAHGIDPSTKKQLWDVPVASPQDIETAVLSARAAFKAWSKTSWAERQDALLTARDVILENKTKLATLLTKEMENLSSLRTWRLSTRLISCSSTVRDMFIQEAGKSNRYRVASLASQEPLKETILQDDDQLRLSIKEKPLGVVAAICPWNYPMVLAMGKIAAALITGNCVIVKPSPFTPYSILKVAELLKGTLPPGVLQALNGDDTLGPALCNHAGIDKISFTGSTATGKKIAATAAKTLKPVTLELGGNSASIICPDVDPAVVAPQVALGSFMNSGQLCVASKRVYVHEDIYDEFLKVMVETVKQWAVGPTSDLKPGTMLGPIQNEMQYNIVTQFFEDTARNGYKFALGAKPDGSDEGFIIKPSIIDNPPDDSLVVTGEAFGPIVPLMKWTDEDEVIRRANDTLTGLGGAVWSKDIDRARRLADRIEAGTIWINSFEKPLPQAHLAGYKESGLGGEWGRRGLLAYCKPQVIHQYKS